MDVGSNEKQLEFEINLFDNFFKKNAFRENDFVL